MPGLLRPMLRAIPARIRLKGRSSNSCPSGAGAGPG